MPFKARLRWFIWLAKLGPFLLFFDGMAAGGQVINRSLLTVGSRVFSSWDALFLVCASNKIFEKEVKIDGEWLLNEDLPAVRKETMLKLFEKRRDLERFLFLVLAMEESQKLNLFLPTAEEQSKALVSIKKSIDVCPWELVSPMAKKHFKSRSEIELGAWTERILRAKSFEQVRGGLDKNSNLLTQNWTWLSPIQSEGP